MNRKAIGIIIGLMAAASVGVIILQYNLIRSAVAVKESEIEQHVFDALNAVAERLEEQERQEAQRYISGYSIQYYKQKQEKDKTILIDNLNKSFGEYADPITGEARLLSQSGSFNFQLRAIEQPIELRINLQQLDDMLGQELFDRGIRTEYSYGVFSNESNSFVISDGHYTVKDDGPKNFLPGSENLYTSNYRVSLFKSGVQGVPPGTLMLFFPNLRGFAWGKVALNIIGSILFTGIMLFCFAYTINVIFKQKKLSEMKTDFMNNMTHEFKTPIATISLAADSINSPMIAGNPEKVQRFANIIKQENRRMNSQVEKVLQMASLDKEDFSLNLGAVNLHEVIQRAVENISLQVEKRDGKAYADLKAERTVVEGDMTHISNIINNLLDNANKYSPDNPEISVHTRNVPNGVEVIIKDRGMGMTKEARKHIFDKFYRVHTGDLHDVKGFGLGLSYVKAMMTAHKGTIDVKSELGKGSSFILSFPFYVNA